MTLKQMVQALIDKGHARDWAREQAMVDFFLLNKDLLNDNLKRTRDCSVCRRNFTELEDRYHYHVCE